MYLVGEGFTGSGAEAAHVNTVLGDRDGPVGVAFATALASPSQGHAPFLVVAQPGLAVQPPTLFVNKAAIAGDRHARMTWGPAQAGVAGGVVDALAQGVVAEADVVGVVLIAAVWVDSDASDEALVFANNRQATLDALRAGAVGFPPVADVLRTATDVWNPFFRPGAGGAAASFS
jgi:5,6,7,8-tetrahydromethanopterin hydro-lyase